MIPLLVARKATAARKQQDIEDQTSVPKDSPKAAPESDPTFQGRCRELLLNVLRLENSRASIIALEGDDAQHMADFLDIVRRLADLITRTQSSFNPRRHSMTTKRTWERVVPIAPYPIFSTASRRRLMLCHVIIIWRRTLAFVRSRGFKLEWSTHLIKMVQHY